MNSHKGREKTQRFKLPQRKSEKLQHLKKPPKHKQEPSQGYSGTESGQEETKSAPQNPPNIGLLVIQWSKKNPRRGESHGKTPSCMINVDRRSDTSDPMAGVHIAQLKIP